MDTAKGVQRAHGAIALRVFHASFATELVSRRAGEAALWVHMTPRL